MPGKKPTNRPSLHIGAILREDILYVERLTVSKAATALGVSRGQLSRLFNGHARLTREMAAKLARAFGYDIEALMVHQAAHDARQARRS